LSRVVRSISHQRCKPRSPSFIALECRPLVPKFGLPLGGQTSLPSTGEHEGWIYIPSRLWFSKFCLVERRPVGSWLLPRATSVYGQVRSLVYSVVLRNNQWIAEGTRILYFCLMMLN